MEVYVAGALFMDLYKRKVLNSYILLGALYCVLQGGLIDTLVWISVTLLLLYPLYQLCALGAGDIKLLCILCGMSSLSLVLQILLEAMFITASAAACIMLAHSIMGEKTNQKAGLGSFPFVLPIFLATIERIETK